LIDEDRDELKIEAMQSSLLKNWSGINVVACQSQNNYRLTVPDWSLLYWWF